MKTSRRHVSTLGGRILREGHLVAIHMVIPYSSRFDANP